MFHDCNKPKQTHLLCVWNERRGNYVWWPGSLVVFWSLLVSIPFFLLHPGRDSVPPPSWVTLSFFLSWIPQSSHVREKVRESICSFSSSGRIQNYMQLIAHFHGQHYSSLLSYWFVHMNEEGGVKDGIIPLPRPISHNMGFFSFFFFGI
jgi:hypothetical protein